MSIAAIPAAILLTGSVWQSVPGAGGPPGRIERGVVVAKAVPPAADGFSVVYARLTVRGPNSARYVIFQPYRQEGQFVPAVGATCDIDFHFVPDGSIRPGDAPRQFMIADHIACDSGSWVPE